MAIADVGDGHKEGSALPLKKRQTRVSFFQQNCIPTVPPLKQDRHYFLYLTIFVGDPLS